METVQIEAARRTLGELVDRARLAGEPTMILRNRTPAAVLVPVGWYDEAAAALESPQPVPAGDLAGIPDPVATHAAQQDAIAAGALDPDPGPE